MTVASRYSMGNCLVVAADDGLGWRHKDGHENRPEFSVENLAWNACDDDEVALWQTHSESG